MYFHVILPTRYVGIDRGSKNAPIILKSLSWERLTVYTRLDVKTAISPQLSHDFDRRSDQGFSELISPPACMREKDKDRIHVQKFTAVRRHEQTKDAMNRHSGLYMVIIELG